MKSRLITFTRSSPAGDRHTLTPLGAGVAALVMGLVAAVGSVRSMAADTPAPAPAVGVEVANEPVEEIMITGTRITSAGYGSPNPVMAVGDDRIDNMAVTDVAEALNKIPTFRPTLTPQTTADGTPTNIAGRIADLRGLGASRTLVLVDGRRFVPSNSQGTVDLNNIPTNLIERVDVVTGGASALYGADAVSGVVNLILDKHYNGFDVEASFGRAEAGDMNRPYFSFKGGTPFAGGKGHFLIGGEYLNDAGSGDCFSRESCAQNINITTNQTPGNGQPFNLMLPNLYVVNSANGLIISGTPAGTTFMPNGTPTKFNYGANPGFVFMQGGDSDNGKQLFLEGALISQQIERYNAMTHIDYDFTDRVQGFFEASYSQVQGTANSIPPVEFPTTLQADNAFLPASLKAVLASNGETSFAFKRQNNDFGVLVPESTDKDMRFVLGVNGLLGEKGHWDAYYQYGHHDNDSQVGNNRINANWALAIDAVTAPNGQVVCRSTLTDPNNGCHPVDLFGTGQSSDSAKSYVNGTSYVTRVIEEQVGAVNFSGSPFNSWAGPVAMAAGLEGRRDTATGTVDAISAAQGWWQNAGTPIDGAVTVTEAYVEADIPLAKSLTLNAADRETHYTTTGNANTWKVGLVWDATDMFRLRATQSHDFRAPNMDELFGPTNSHPTILIDPSTNTQVFVTQHQGGNPNLQPETGDTTTFGVVFQGREAMQGLKTSLDYYHIKIKDAVDIVNPQTILDRCAAGDQLYCQYVTRDSAGVVTDLTVTYLNLDKVDTSGLDLSADYTLPLSKLGASGGGTLSFGLIANYVYHLRLTDSGGHTVDRAGQTGLELLGTPGMPRYNINLLTTYAQGPGSVSLQARFIASGTFDPELIGPDKSNYDPNLPNSINRNTVASSWYADLAAKYDIYNGGSRNVQLFGAINNMFDKQPPFLPSFHNAIFFDNVGRYYTAGVRIKF